MTKFKWGGAEVLKLQILFVFELIDTESKAVQYNQKSTSYIHEDKKDMRGFHLFDHEKF